MFPLFRPFLRVSSRFPASGPGTLPSITAAGIAVLLFVSGCAAVGPVYREPRPEVPAEWRAPAGEAPALLEEWWEVFEDPQLTELVADVRENNYDLAAAVARLDGYAAGYGIARADLLPMLGARGAVVRDRETEQVRNPLGQPLPDNPAWIHQAGFMMSWELDVWGKARQNLESARGLRDASLEDVRNIAVILQAAAAAEYILVRTIQQRLAYADRNIRLQKETLELVRDRYRAGLSGELDVRQAEMNLAGTRARVPQLESRLTAALNALCFLTGRRPGQVDHLREPGEVPAAETLPGTLPADLLRRRPDIRAAERRLAARTARIGIARADYLPAFSLDGTFALAATDRDELFTSEAQKYQVGPSFRWLLFNAGKVRYHVRAEEAAAEAALAQYEQTVLGAWRECEDALAAYDSEQRTAAELREAVAAAEQSVGLVNSLYRAGLVNFQSVLDSQRQLAFYQDELAQSLGRGAAALVSVYKAFGGGWAPEDTAFQR